MELQIAGSILTSAELGVLLRPTFGNTQELIDFCRRSQRDHLFHAVTLGTVEGGRYWRQVLDIGVAASPAVFTVSANGTIGLDYLAKVFAYSGVDRLLDAVTPLLLERVFTIGYEDQARTLPEASLSNILTDIAINQMWFADEVLAGRLTDVALNYLALEKDADPGIFAMGVGLYAVRRGSDQQILTLARPDPLTLDSVLKYSRARE